MSSPLRVLIVEDSPDDAEVLAHELRRGGYDPACERVETAPAMRAALERQAWDIVLSDYDMPHFSGPAALEVLKQSGLDLPFIVVSGSVGEEAAVEILLAGARDFIFKHKLGRLLPAVRRELREAEGRRERQRVGAALRESEERYRSLADNALVGIYRTALTGEILYVNDALAKMLEFDSGEEMRQANVLTRYRNPADRQALLEALQASGKVESVELDVLTQTGQSRNVLLSATLEGEVLSGMIVDITARKQAEAALRASEERYRTLAEAAHDSIFIIGRDDRIEYVNSFAARQLGGRPEDFVGQPRTLLFPAQTAERQQRSLQQVMETGQPIYAETETSFPGGDAWLGTWLVPLRDEGGEAHAVLGVSRDITERKQAEATLRASEAELRALFAAMHDVVIVYDREGRYLKIAPTDASLLYRPPADMLGKTVHEVLPAAPADLLLEHIRRALDTQQTVRLDYSLNIGGQEFWFAGTISPMPGDTAILVAHDITNRKQSETALRRREAILEAVGAVAEQFLQPADWEINVQAALTRLGQATGVSRVYIFENHAGPDGVLLTSQRYEWAAPGVTPQIDSPDLQGIPLEAAGFGRWIEVLSRGQVIYGHVREFPESEQALLAPQDILSIVVVPVFAGPAWWGFIGFDECVREREWPASEVDALRAAVGILGAAIQRRRSEETLAASERRFRALIENSSDGIVLISADGTILYDSPAITRILGYTSQERVGSRVFDYMHPDERQSAEDVFRQFAQTPGATVYSQGRFLLRDGSWRWLEGMRSNLLTDPIIQAIVVNYRDVTERKQAEAEILRRNEELAAIATVSSALRIAQTRTEIMSVVLDELLDLLKADNASLAMRDPVSGETVIEFVHGTGQAGTGVRLPPGEGISGYVISTGQPYLSNDLRADPRFAGRDLLGDLRAGACVPLIVQGQTIGALWVTRVPRASASAGRGAGEAHPDITADELRLLAAIADIAANAIHRTTLYEQTEQRLERLDGLRVIDAAITSSLDLRVTLNVLLDQVTTQLRVDAADVLLLDTNTHVLEYAAGRGFRGSAITRTHMRLGEGHAGRAALERRIVSAPGQPGSGAVFVRAGLLAGENFVAHHVAPLVAKGQVKGVLEIFHRAALNPDPEWQEFLETLAGQAAIAIDNIQLFEGLQRSNLELGLAYDETIEGWSKALDLRDRETEGHTRRVTEVTLRLARALGVADEELVHIRRGALLHDIGKMGIPDGILLKPGPLTDEEWAIMRRHPEYAYEMLQPIAYLRRALDIPYCHHEKWDGTGYPRGLRGQAIPLAARLFAVVDVWDALRSDRPYRAAWPDEQVREHIRTLAGRHFDPKAVEAFLALEA